MLRIERVGKAQAKETHLLRYSLPKEYTPKGRDEGFISFICKRCFATTTAFQRELGELRSSANDVDFADKYNGLMFDHGIESWDTNIADDKDKILECNRENFIMLYNAVGVPALRDALNNLDSSLAKIGSYEVVTPNEKKTY